MTVAALYVERDGVYAGLPGVEVWDESRDARTYAGPWPVVAHPPCPAWSRMAGFRMFVWGLEPGKDGGCFEAALESVRRWGGVLEHPAFSKAWDAFGLPKPVTHHGWTGGLCGGFSAYVEQGRYGQELLKRTWLYCYGIEPGQLAWGYTPNSGECGKWSAAWNRGGGSNGRRSHTPEAFRDVLLDMARSAVGVPVAAPQDSAQDSDPTVRTIPGSPETKGPSTSPGEPGALARARAVEMPGSAESATPSPRSPGVPVAAPAEEPPQ